MFISTPAMKKGPEKNSLPRPSFCGVGNLFVYARHGIELQIHRRQTRRDIEASVAFDTKRLQRDRPVHSADQHVAAEPQSDRRARGGSAVVAG